MTATFSEQGNTLSVAAPACAANDSDPNNDPVTAVLDVPPDHGTLSLNSNGSFSYTPDTGFTGTDSFTYEANDGTVDSNIATVTIEVTSQPSVPTLHVGDLDGSATWVNKTKWAATVIATVYDETGDPVPNATVEGMWSNGLTSTATTNSAGQATVLSGNLDRSINSVTFAATNIAHRVVAVRARGQHGPRWRQWRHRDYRSQTADATGCRQCQLVCSRGQPDRGLGRSRGQPGPVALVPADRFGPAAGDSRANN